MMRNVLIGTPAHDGKVCAEYATSLVQTVLGAATRRINVQVMLCMGDALVELARDGIVASAMDMEGGQGADDLVFIDSDQSWTIDQFMRLIDHDVPVVGYPVPQKKEDEEIYNVMLRPDMPMARCGRTGLLKVPGIGTGMLRLRRDAYEAVWRNSKPYNRRGRDLRRVFELWVMDGRIWSEDFVMCQKLRALGFDIHCDDAHTIDHLGRKNFQGDFAGWLRRNARAAA